MAKQLFSIIIILLLSQTVRAQLAGQKKIDSLLTIIPAAKNDSNKVKVLSALSEIYYPLDYKKGIDYGEQALKLAKKINWKKGVEHAYNSLGSNYWAKYDIVRAQDYYGESLKVAREIGDERYIAVNIHDIGICYEIQGNFQKAIEYYMLGLKLSAATGGDNTGIISSYANIGDIYFGHSKYTEALDYYSRALKKAREIKDERNIAFYSQQVGSAHAMLGNYAKALSYQQSALRIFKKLKNNEDIAVSLKRLAEFYMQFKNYPEAVAKGQDALTELSKVKGFTTKKLEANFYAIIGLAYFEWAKKEPPHPLPKNNLRTNYLQLAANNFQKSANIASANNYREVATESLQLLSDVEQAQGRFADALKNYKAYTSQKDSFSSSEKDREYTQHAQAFEYTRKKDSLNYAEKLAKQEIVTVKAISASQLKQGALYAIIVIVVLLLITSYFIFRNRVQQVRFNASLAKEKSEIELNQLAFENKLNDLTLASLKSQMNPHFIFNCLNSIKYYVEKNETDAASLYITRFSKLIRTILDNARTEKTTLSAEIELIDLYLQMEQMRLKGKLRYKFEIAEDIDTDFIEIPPLLIQPYIENAIWHGLMPKEEGGIITLKISAENNCLTVTITDTGIGREKAAEIKRKNNFNHTSHGSTLNNERIAMFNAKYKTNIEVILTDLKDSASQPCGTLVTIKFLF